MRYVVENHPYDRGYFDAVKGRQAKQREGEYWQGYRQARRELRAERREAIDSLLAAAK